MRETIALAPRAYGRGAYGLVLVAIWEDPRWNDRWETTSTCDERQAIYDQVAARMAGWSPPPLAMMVGILPYGDLVLAVES